MDRITERTEHGVVIRKDLDIGVITARDFDKLQYVLSVLAAYEDLGITPEQLKEILTNKKEYQEAEKQGLLLHLPCKAGDTVYLEAEYENEITEGRVTEISVLPDGICIYIERENGD